MDKYYLAVKAFIKIRDLPYHISIQGEEGYDCGDKTKKLILELKQLGISGRIRICFFQWSTLGLPKIVTKINHDNECSHCFTEIKNAKGEWIFVDPTWNKNLEKAGFEIANWDGVNPTALAVKCDKILSPEDSIKYMEQIDCEEDLVKNGNFYDAINKYCDSFLN